MVIDDQTEVTAFLSAPGALGGAAVERIETHSARVFLAGDRAWKMKRAVRFDYLDFSTLERRRQACEAEVAVNRRTAPALYRRVVPVTRARDGQLALDGPGTPIEWLIEMARFDGEALLDRVAQTGRLDADLCRRLAEGVAAFHATAAVRREHGGLDEWRWVVEGNAAGLAEEGDFLPPDRRGELAERSRAALAQHAARIEARRAAGRVRHCHGDLHLGNIVLLDGVPTLFDAIEFNDRIACIDAYYDLAFLLMDVWHRGLPRLANVILNAYTGASGDLEGLALLPFFLSCRAAVKAKTDATAAHGCDDDRRREALRQSSREYLELAIAVLSPPEPLLVAIGGWSGTGKSTLAAALAPGCGAVPGAVHVRTDAVRKRLMGVAPDVRLGEAGYTPEVSARVYARARALAADVVQTGHAVIIDGVFGREDERAAMASVAASQAVPFVGLWLDAEDDLRAARVDARMHDVSDADAGVARQQARHDPGALDWPRLDASLAPDRVAAAARAAIEARGRGFPAG